MGTMSHNCERSESEWSKCGNEKKRVHVNHNITPLLASEVSTEDSEISMWFSSHIGESNAIVVKDRVVTDFLDVFRSSHSSLCLPFSLEGGIGFG